MALLRTKEIRAMDAPAREKKLKELRDELMHERGVAAMGGAPPNPGKIRALRKNIARIYTVQSEEGAVPATASPAAPTETKRESETPRRKPRAEKEAPEDEELDEADENLEDQR